MNAAEPLRDALARAMQNAGLLETPAPAAALRWIETFIEAYPSQCEPVEAALPQVRALRAEAVIVPALELEKLRSRDVLFFLDAFGQYVDDQRELRGLPLEHDLREIAAEFGLTQAQARYAARMALTGEKEGAPLELLVPLLGHDRILIRIGAISSRLLHGRGLEPIKYGPDGRPFEPMRGEKPRA
jgi:Anticodon binding domain